MTAALRWFGPLARWLRLARPGPAAASQPGSPSPSGDVTVPFTAAFGPHRGVSGPGNAAGSAMDASGSASASRRHQGAASAAGARGPSAGVSGPAGAAGPPVGGNAREGPFEGSADAPGPLVGISGQSGTPGGRPPVRRDRPGRRRLGSAMRRLMVTPTFAAGLGVVVAASLAANMTKTVLHFSSPVPGGQCQAGACHVQPSHGGTLASARPGVPIAVPRKGAGRAGSNTPGAESPSAGGQGGGGDGQVRITYQVTEQWSGGFADQITIGGLSGQDGAWSLAVAYPGARIAGVQGASWLWRSADSGVAQGAAQGNPGGDQQGGDGRGGDGRGGGGQGGNQQGGGESSGSGGVAQFVITVDGQVVPPSGCSFDGERCAFSAAGPQ